jgi:hypothetical protein
MDLLFPAELALPKLQGMEQARAAWAQERDEIKEQMKQWFVRKSELDWKENPRNPNQFLNLSRKISRGAPKSCSA